MNQEHKTTAMAELFKRLDNNEPIMPNTRKWLLELEKLQLLEAFKFDPELMKIAYKTPGEWFKKTYGR